MNLFGLVLGFVGLFPGDARCGGPDVAALRLAILRSIF